MAIYYPDMMPRDGGPVNDGRGHPSKAPKSTLPALAANVQPAITTAPLGPNSSLVRPPFLGAFRIPLGVGLGRKELDVHAPPLPLLQDRAQGLIVS